MRRRKKLFLIASFLLFSLSFFQMNFTPILFRINAFKLADQTLVTSTSYVVDAIAVWQHGENEIRDVWYSIWDDATTQWWTPSGVQASPIVELAGNDVDPNIAFDRQGNAIAVWSHETGNAGLGYDIWYSRWSGYSWTPPAEVASLTGDDTDPAVAFDTNGWAITTWVHNGTYIYYSLWNGTNWIGPAQAIVSDWPLLPFWGSNLPELCFTSSKTKGGSYTDHEAVAIWTQWVIYPEVPPQLISRIYYALWDGKAWSPSPAQEIPGQALNSADDGNLAMSRNGISSDNLNNAIAVWGTEDKTKPIYYAVWNGHIWNDSTALDAQNVYGIMPAIAFDPANDAILSFTHNTTNIWHSKRVGGVWQTATEAANSSGNDYRPSIAFLGSNRAVAVWWSDVETFAPNEVFYSIWDPTTDAWSPAASIVPLGLPGSDTNPTIASVSGSPTMPVTVPAKIHDIAIVDVNPSKTVAGQNYPVFINVTVENQGTEAESFDVSAYYNLSLIDEVIGVSLMPGEKKTLTFTWNTTAVTKATYTLSAEASVVPGETDTADNTFTDGAVQITIPGDINGNKIVDIYDLAGIGKAYGTTAGNLNWNENADITGDGVIDIYDLTICGKNYGTMNL